jgi:tetratricopeptide (TPR) repeat protein
VDHLLADLSRRLGQWDRARQLYRSVLEAEPGNAAALVDLGIYHFERGDYAGAVRLFRRAVESDPTYAVGWFDLSQAYSKQYLFGDVRQALARAHELTSPGLEVSRWMVASGELGIVAADGGLARAGEVRRRLAESWLPTTGKGLLLARLREVRSLGLALGAAALAVALQLLRRRRSRRAEPEGGPAPAEAGVRLLGGLWRRALLPGVPSLVDGHGARAYLALLLPAVLVLLPGADALTFELPLGHYAGPVAAVASLIGAALWLGARLLLARRRV